MCMVKVWIVNRKIHSQTQSMYNSILITTRTSSLALWLTKSQHYLCFDSHPTRLVSKPVLKSASAEVTGCDSQLPRGDIYRGGLTLCTVWVSVNWLVRDSWFWVWLTPHKFTIESAQSNYTWPSNCLTIAGLSLSSKAKMVQCLCGSIMHIAM